MQTQKKLLTLKRVIFIGGGLLVVVLVWVIMMVKSKHIAVAAGEGRQHGEASMAWPSKEGQPTTWAAPKNVACGTSPALPKGLCAPGARMCACLACTATRRMCPI